CDNLDNDCDGTIDEGISRPCGTGTCRGVETCSAGGWVGCTAQQPLPEVCNGLDDNCDGIRDGFSEACSTMPPLPPENYPVDDPRNNPGDPSNNPIPENICRPGIKTCPANVGPPNQFGACLGEQQPLTEVCNGLDDDCDNLIDEAPPVACTTNAQCPPITPTCDNPTAAPNAGQCRPADCSSNCGVGSLVCVNGALQCNAMPAPSDDSCDGNDDDCDGVVDEDFVGGPCTGSPPVCNGMEQCVNGAVVCSGGPIAQESCNCLDDNCNNQVDEGSLCPAGAECVSCQCAFRCGPGEFPCPLGKICKDEFCITDVCFGVTCPDVGGDKQVCRPDPAQPNMPQCISACDPAVQQCPSPLICHGPSGECRPDDCTTFPERCGPGEDCIAGQCVSNPCQGVTCGEGQYCVGGNCVHSCADVECPNGQRCRLGMCETDPCGAPCPFPKVCNDATGTCVNDPCLPVQCPQGQECNPNQGGQCQDSGCIGTVCPNPGESCHLGTCDRPSGPDADVEVRVTTGGGGGCAAGGEAGGLSGLVGLALLAVLRRRRGVRS
ncbi:MAG: MopE-related protein, partial [Kofleriaceae bacterium]